MEINENIVNDRQIKETISGHTYKNTYIADALDYKTWL